MHDSEIKFEFEFGSDCINVDHPFVQEVFAHKETNLNQKTRQLILELFKFILNFEHTDSTEETFKTLDILQKELKNYIPINYELSKVDFPLKD